jgi:hypothetical protein
MRSCGPSPTATSSRGAAAGLQTTALVHEAYLKLVDQSRAALKRGGGLVRVVECRFFGGLTEDEIAAVLGVTVRTVQRDWPRRGHELRSPRDTEPDWIDTDASLL